MIVALARDGKRIGVTAVSHKVIRNLLKEVLNAARMEGVPLTAIHKVSKSGGESIEGLEEVTDNAKARAGLDSGKVAGGTTWFWAREDMIESLDYLFIDEAGQMSLAHALAAGRAARNLVLLGDPQQLEQPQRGAHPEGAEVAALVHVLGGRKTIADEAGLFLDESWRLHPRICRFTSELFYEGRLRSRDGLERQALKGGTPFAGSGLFYVPVEHAGNQNSSPEEVEAVARIVRSLLSPGVSWTDAQGAVRRLQQSDILIVAPYNAQVAALGSRLPGDACRHGGQVPGSAGAGGHLLHDELGSGGRPARHGLSLQPQSPERGHEPRAVRLYPRCRASSPGARVQLPRADALGEWRVPLPGIGGAGGHLTIRAEGGV